MARVRAMFAGKVIAESHHTVVVEGNHYFPKESVNFDFLNLTETLTHCPWKGEAAYYTVEAEGQKAVDGCWYYPHPSDEAKILINHFAFWGDIKIVKDSEGERLENICRETTKFMRAVVENTKVAEKKCPKVETEVTQYLKSLHEETLTYVLPHDYLNNLSFFNYYNSTNATFFTDRNYQIQLRNPTFNWSFDHLNLSDNLPDFLAQFDVLEGELGVYLDKLQGHGWVKIPKVKTQKDGKNHFYSIDIAITRHGDLDHLQGLQGQFIEITREVELTKSVEDLLNNAGQGFLSFSGDYLIKPKYSKVCESFLEEEMGGKNIIELLIKEDDKRKALKEALDLIFSETTDIEMLREILLKEVEIEGRYLKIEYRWIPKDDYNLENGMMLILSDITKEKELERTLAADQKRQERLIKVVSDRQGFIDMQQELGDIFINIQNALSAFNPKVDINELFRFFHTIKGGSAVYALESIVEITHGIEGELSVLKETPSNYNKESYEALLEKSKEVERIYNDVINELNELIGISQSDEKTVTLKMSDLDKLQNLISNQEAYSFIGDLKKDPLLPILNKFKSSALSLAEDLNKEITVEIEDNDVIIDKEKVSNVLTPLIHIVRNSVDHGIEDSDTRMMCDKDPVGHLKFKSFKVDGTLHIEFRDDGGGIDPQRMKGLALEKGIVEEEWAQSASEQDLVELIFHPGFSSKEEVSEISGRGVGMDAVKASLVDNEGEIRVESTVGEGTIFTIRIPNVS